MPILNLLIGRLKKPRYLDSIAAPSARFPRCFQLFVFVCFALLSKRESQSVRRDTWSLSQVVCIRTNTRKYTHYLIAWKPEVSHLLYGDLKTCKGLLESSVKCTKLVSVQIQQIWQSLRTGLTPPSVPHRYKLPEVTSPTPPLSPTSWTSRSSTAAAPSGRLHCRLRQC